MTLKISLHKTLGNTFFSLICSIAFFLVALSLMPSFVYAQTIEDLTLDMQNLYEQNYEKISTNSSPTSPENIAVQELSETFDIPADDIEQLLSGNINTDTEVFEAYCPTPSGGNTFQDFVACQDKLQTIFQKKRSDHVFTQRLEKYAKSSQAFRNGTLSDTNNKGFDLIVDLNILDVLLFGDKFSRPENASPFFPMRELPNVETTKKDFGEENESENSENNTDENNGSEDNNEQIEEQCQNSTNPIVLLLCEEIFSQNTENDEDENQSVDLNTFCIDPEALFFSSSNNRLEQQKKLEIKKQCQNSTDPIVLLLCEEIFSQNTENNESEDTSRISLQDQQYGNYISRSEQLLGGDYPDIEQFVEADKEKGCGNDEKPFFGGRMCIPEFCKDLVCIKILLKKGYRATALRPLDCVECHIDRANEALLPLASIPGQLTPNSNPLEPNFLSAISNLFKGGDYSNHFILQKKQLPFLVYDQSITEQKKEIPPQEPQDIFDTSLEKKITQNTNLYASMFSRCTEAKESKVGLNMQDHIDFCTKIKQEETLQNSVSTSAYEAEVKNQLASEEYHNVVEPFFLQLSGDMQSINNEILSISQKRVQEVSIHCSEANQN